MEATEKKHDWDRTSSSPRSPIHSRPMFGLKGNREPEPGPRKWTIEVHDRNDGSFPYETFRTSLDTYTRAALDMSVNEILAKQGHNVCSTPKLGKNLKKGLYEFKVSKTLSVLCSELGIPVPEAFTGDKPVLLRVFFAVEGERIVLLLSGYDKKKDDKGKRQNKEIDAARALLAEHKARSKGKNKRN